MCRDGSYKTVSNEMGRRHLINTEAAITDICIYTVHASHIYCMYVNLDSQHGVLMRRSVLHKACERSKVKPKCIHTHLILNTSSHTLHMMYCIHNIITASPKLNVYTMYRQYLFTFIPASGSSSSLLLSHMGELCSEVWLSAKISTPVS